jgi:hypothetical protein
MFENDTMGLSLFKNAYSSHTTYSVPIGLNPQHRIVMNKAGERVS